MPDLLLRMHEIEGLVSIIVPVYKTGPILRETIQSVVDQTYSEFELIAIDDGSKDDSIAYALDFRDARISAVSQENQGMTRTRNNGLKLARGEFVLFLDHDDLLSPDFLEVRVDSLKRNTDIGFVGGPVRTFPDDVREYKAAAESVEEELLFFSPDHVSTPSSYLIRRKVLSEFGIEFNTLLSSTADQFFLLQLSRVTRGKCLNSGPLFYRVSPQGFSQTMSPALLQDNELFLEELKRTGLLPEKDRARFLCLYHFMLAGSYKRMGGMNKALLYLVRSLAASPGEFVLRLTSGGRSGERT